MEKPNTQNQKTQKIERKTTILAVVNGDRYSSGPVIVLVNGINKN